MANFSGRFSSNDKASSKICNGLVEFYIDWQVIRDLDYNTYKYKADLYMDASKCKYLVLSIDTHGTAYLAIGEWSESSMSTVPWAKDDFIMPEFGLLDGVPKNLLLASVETESRPVSTDPVLVDIYAFMSLSGTIKAYESNILSYVGYNLNSIHIGHSNPNPEAPNFTVRGIIPNSITDISGSGVLGSAHNITVNKGEPEFTHTIECICGGDKVTVCTKSSAESISFTPPLSFAAQNTHGTDLDATFKITTYYGDRVKDIQTVDYAFTIPSTVIPSCTLEITDGEFKDGNYVSAVYGGYVQGHSRFHIKTVPTLAYGSPIEKYEVVVDGLIYNLTEAEMDTPLIKDSGAHSIKARVTDARGHTSEYHATTENVQAYSAPVVSDLTASRCNIDGTDNPQGDCMKVVFSAAVTPLSNKNSAVYSIVHSKSSGLDYVERVLGDYTGQYTVTNGVYIFAADLDSTYTIQVTAIDDFEEHTRSAGGGLTTILMNWLASGRGMCFGGVATLEDTVECQFKFYPSGGFILPPYPYDTLHSTNPNIYYVENPADVDGSPTADPYILEILPISSAGLEILQRITTCPQGEPPRVLVRILRDSLWGSFYDIATGETVA